MSLEEQIDAVIHLQNIVSIASKELVFEQFDYYTMTIYTIAVKEDK